MGPYAVVGKTVGGVTHFGAPLLLQAGLATYERIIPVIGNFWGQQSLASPSDAAVREAPHSESAPVKRLLGLLHPSASLAATLPSGAAKLAAEEPDRTKASETHRARGGIIHGL